MSEVDSIADKMRKNGMQWFGSVLVIGQNCGWSGEKLGAD